ncbi:MAG: (2Fe-2S) ferredoxin domain-containing protein [Acholeplasmataceae bacterium]|nr:(2Fe-2S) ferredoxin domain-containing protein [Acholeplasmataceae bacterium]
MKSLEELKKLRDESLKKMTMRYVTDGFRIQVGMGTCGIASGARAILSTLLEEVEKNNLQNVSVTQVGCMGECAYEPMAELIDESGQSFVYCNLTEVSAKEIIERHVINHEPITRLLLTTKKG